MIQITAQNGQTYKVASEKEGFTLNDLPFQWDLQPEGDSRFHALYNNKSVTLELVSADWEKKVFQVKVNSNIYTLNAKDRFDLLLEELGMEAAASAKAADLKAPMPGQVLDVMVAPGDAIKEGDKLVVLEAMKMENVLKASADAVVKEVRVKKGESVQKNEVMVIFES